MPHQSNPRPKRLSSTPKTEAAKVTQPSPKPKKPKKIQKPARRPREKRSQNQLPKGDKPISFGIPITRPLARKARQFSIILANKMFAFLSRKDAPRILAAALIVMTIITNPWFVIGLFFLLAAITGLIAYGLGADRCSRLISARFAKLKKQNPEKADILLTRAIFLRNGLERLLDKLPEDWTRGLYLPELEETTDQPLPDADPFQKLRQ